jgi:hypothetical protein
MSTVIEFGTRITTRTPSRTRPPTPRRCTLGDNLQKLAYVHPPSIYVLERVVTRMLARYARRKGGA